jgi:dipeptidyl aminopeptidase/acylaminoacyl peptidase
MPAATGTGRRPAVVYVHGGPWAQVSDNWFDGLFMQSLSQNGFACFAPNFRGSSGFGAEFQDLDMGDPGGGDLEDVVRGAEWLRKQPNVQESKIAILGGSYGGYMTLIALTKKPDVFAVGVALVPVVDWLKMHQLSDPAYRAFIEALFRGSPSEKKNLYHDRSPASFVSDISAPVMIMAGKNDYRCPIQPIGDFVEKLKTMKHPYEFMLEEKAGHQSALMNQEESILIFNNIVNYIKRVLC